jgi:hypothetical protein
MLLSTLALTCIASLRVVVGCCSQARGKESVWDGDVDARHFWDLACKIIASDKLPPDDVVSLLSVSMSWKWAAVRYSCQALWYKFLHMWMGCNMIWTTQPCGTTCCICEVIQFNASLIAPQVPSPPPTHTASHRVGDQHSLYFMSQHLTWVPINYCYLHCPLICSGRRCIVGIVVLHRCWLYKFT